MEMKILCNVACEMRRWFGRVGSSIEGEPDLERFRIPGNLPLPLGVPTGVLSPMVLC